VPPGYVPVHWIQLGLVVTFIHLHSTRNSAKVADMSLWFTVKIKTTDGKTVRRSVYRNHTTEFRGPAFEMHQCTPEAQNRETVLRTIAETFQVPDQSVTIVGGRKHEANR
jgi:hypothetical protein